MVVGVKIRETIHHGDYRNVRTVDIGQALTFAAMSDVLTSSPYGMGKTLEDHAKNRYVGKLFTDLLTAGNGEFGWARYEVVEK